MDGRGRIKYFPLRQPRQSGSRTSDETYAWQTWFDHVGAEVALTRDIGLIGQCDQGQHTQGADLGCRGTPFDLLRVQTRTSMPFPAADPRFSAATCDLSTL